MKESIILLLVIVLCYVACQKSYLGEPQHSLKLMPEQCRKNNIMDRQCCLFPPFFTREVARECGARFILNVVYNESQIAALRREIHQGCKYWTCVLENYDLLLPDEFVNEEKYYTHLDRWVDLNQNFADVMLNAKVYCKAHYRPMLPMKQCEFQEFNSCIRNFVNVNCPMVIPTKECDSWKAFYEECKEFYV